MESKRTAAGQYCPDWFERARFDEERTRQQLRWGRPLRLHDEAPSTNDLAFEAAREGAPNGAVFHALQQTSGRGRRGNAWSSPPGDSVAVSVLLRSPDLARHLTGLSLLTGLALAEAVDALAPSLKLQLKWPNDVMVHGRKLAGILIESRFVPTPQGKDLAVVVGVGVNTRVSSFPEELSHATSLSMEGEAGVRHEDLLAAFLTRLEKHTLRLLAHGLPPALPMLRDRDALSGRSLRIEDAQATDKDDKDLEGGIVLSGKGGGIHDDGRLILLTEAGPLFVRSGHVIVNLQ